MSKMSVAFPGIGPWPRAPSEIRRDCQLGPLPLGHLGDALLPTLNHFFLAESELEGPPTVSRAVNLLPILQSEHVVTRHLVAFLRKVSSIPSLQGLDLHSHGGVRGLVSLVEVNQAIKAR